MDIRQPLTSTEFISRYTLLKPLADGKVRSLSAVAGATGDVVMVHYLIGSSEENEALLDAIDRLEPADRKKVVEGFVIESNHVVVTQFLSGFTSLGDWLGHHGVAASIPTIPASEGKEPGEFTRLFGLGELAESPQPTGEQQAAPQQTAPQPIATQPIAPQPTATQPIAPKSTAPRPAAPRPPAEPAVPSPAEDTGSGDTRRAGAGNREGRTFEWLDTVPQIPKPRISGSQVSGSQPSGSQPSDPRSPDAPPAAKHDSDTPSSTSEPAGGSGPGEFTRLFGAYQAPPATAPAAHRASPSPRPATAPPPAPRPSSTVPPPPAANVRAPSPAPASAPTPAAPPPRPALTMPPMPAVKPPPVAPTTPPAPRMPAVVPMPGAAPIEPQPPAPLPPPLAQTAPPPAPAPLAGASAQSEYTRLIASATPVTSPAITGGGSTPAVPAASTPQPGASETRTAAQGGASKPPSYLPLIITLNVIVLVAIGLVLYFVLRH
jgi:hypothetical protein